MIREGKNKSVFWKLEGRYDVKKAFLNCAAIILEKNLTFVNSIILYFYAMEQHHIEGMRNAGSELELLFIEGE